MAPSITQFGQIMGDRSFTAACQSPEVGQMLLRHLDEPVNLRFFPLEKSLIPQHQVNCDFLVDGMVQHGFSHLNLK